MGVARRTRRSGGGRCLVAAAFGCSALGLAPLSALAVEVVPAPGWHTHNVAGLAILIGLVAFATILSLLHLSERSRWTRRERELSAGLAALSGAHDRAEMFLNAERQVVVTWDAQGQPEIEGDVSLALDGARGAAGAGRLVDFGSWLVAADAQALQAAVETLRSKGTGFRLDLHGLTGRSIDAQGLAVAGRALLRLRETTRERRELVELRETLEDARRGLSSLAGLLDAIPQPVWRRNRDGGLAWVNLAYVAAVEAKSREEALEAGTELLDRQARDLILAEAAKPRTAGAARTTLRLSAVVKGERRMVDVTETPQEHGRVGVAVDVNELESVRIDLQRQMDANVRTLDQLPTAVAMFDARQRLIFHNAAYRQLWDLDPLFLKASPKDGEVLERLRAQRKLQEQADFKAWKESVLAAYQDAEASEHWWYLPDGRILRVVAQPNPQGGVTYLFEDVSDRVKLESSYNSLLLVQAETLDTLAEPVAVFGADGRLTFANRAFATLWRLDAETVAARPHVDAVIAACRVLAPAEEAWHDIRDAVVGMESRSTMGRRLNVVDGTVLDCAAQPLPDGATLITLIDVTASVNVERMLTEKNDTLEKAAKLRDTFVHHVSYELRSPLTNIIGFTQLLGDGTVGALNTRQREYADHILRSSGSLLVIINDILDLASIDAGSLELQREVIDVRSTIEASVRGIEDRLKEARVDLDLDVPDEIGSMLADGKRVRQVLFNLLSNAVGFSEAGQRVSLSASRTESDLVLVVADQGRGMPPEVAERVFDRFESHSFGTGHRGVGLGLSIVRSFVELHGGRVNLDTAPGAGTRVTSTFPLAGPPPPPLEAA